MFSVAPAKPRIGGGVPLPCGVVTQHAPTFLEETEVEPVPGVPGRYAATFSGMWSGPRAPQGGVVAATTLRAMTAELANDSHRLRTSTTVFAAMVSSGDAEIDVEVLRRGRSVSQVQGTVRAAAEVAPGHRTLAVFGRERAAGFEFTELRMPAVPPPEDCSGIPEERPAPSIYDVPFWRCIQAADVEFHYPWETGWRGGRARGVRWVRYRRAPRLADGSIDALAYLPLVDVIPGAAQQWVGPGERRFIAPTLDLTVHFLDVTDDEWILQVMRMRRATHGYGSGEMQLWSRDRRLLAHASQTMFFADQ